jgi:protocatechuate 3,4-dioxygenase beta subunit
MMFGGKKTEVLRGKDAATLLGVEESPDLFAIPDLHTTNVTLKVSAAGFADASFGPLDVASGARIESNIDLTPEISISGIVRDPEGAPVAGATVTVRPPDDDSADFVGRHVFRKRAVRLEASSEGGAKLMSDNKTKSATTGADGTFRVTGLGPGEVTVKARHADFASSEAIKVMLEAGHRSEGHELQLRAAGRLEGVAYDAEHRPLGGGRVTLTPADKEENEGFSFVMPQMPSGALSATADMEGKFTIQGLAPGRYFAELKEPPRPTGGAMIVMQLPDQNAEPKGVPVEIEAGQTTRVDLSLSPKAQLVGRVTEAGQPMAGVKVMAQKAGGFPFMGGPNTVTKADGSFEIRDLEAGDYTLRVSPKQAPLAVERQVTMRAKEETRCDVALPLGVIAGQVMDETTGAPLEGVEVQAGHAREEGEEGGGGRQATGMMVFRSVTSDDEGGGSSFSMSVGGGPPSRIVTDREGRYELRSLEAGKYKVTIQGKGITRSAKDSVQVAQDQRTEHVDFKTTRGATLIVKPEAPSGGQIMFCSARLAPVDKPDEETHQFAQGDDPVRFEGLKAGRYRVQLDSDQRHGETVVEIASGEEKTITVPVREGA